MFFLRSLCGRLLQYLTMCAPPCAFRRPDMWMKSRLNLLHTEAYISSALNTESSRLKAGSRGQRLRKKGWSGRAMFLKKHFATASAGGPSRQFDQERVVISSSEDLQRECDSLRRSDSIIIYFWGAGGGWRMVERRAVSSLKAETWLADCVRGWLNREHMKKRPCQVNGGSRERGEWNDRLPDWTCAELRL